jgi:hypothetical protein
MDHPRVRSGAACPLCRGRKEVGPVACWPCYRARGLRDGNARADAIIERAEAEAEFRDARRPARPLSSNRAATSRSGVVLSLTGGEESVAVRPPAKRSGNSSTAAPPRHDG